jgi:hypothetical protein
MKTVTIQTQVKNFSRYPIDLVWENAKDLEHVGFLHGNTNKFFKLLHVEPDPSGRHEYGMMVFRTLRRFHFLSFGTFGFRKIISKYNLYQMEYIPLIGMTIALNSVLKPNPDPEFPTLMLDEVVLELPRPLAFLGHYMARGLQRHTSIQCAEDEPFRARRQLLQSRKINFPFSIFNLSQWHELTSKFTEKPVTE